MTQQPEVTSDALRGRNADATRRALLEAAMRRFTVVGYERTTTREIAADAHVNVSLINRYFGSKDGLFAAVMQESASMIEQAGPRRPISSIDSILDKLDPNCWPEFGSEHPLSLLLGDVGGDERAGELRRKSLNAIISWLSEESEVENPAASHDAALRAELVLALIAGVITLRATVPDGALATTDIDRLRAVLKQATTSLLGLSGD